MEKLSKREEEKEDNNAQPFSKDLYG